MNTNNKKPFTGSKHTPNIGTKAWKTQILKALEAPSFKLNLYWEDLEPITNDSKLGIYWYNWSNTQINQYNEAKRFLKSLIGKYDNISVRPKPEQHI